MALYVIGSFFPALAARVNTPFTGITHWYTGTLHTAFEHASRMPLKESNMSKWQFFKKIEFIIACKYNNSSVYPMLDLGKIVRQC